MKSNDLKQISTKDLIQGEMNEWRTNRGCVWRIRRVLLGAVGLLLVLVGIGFIYEAIASTNDAPNLVPPGTLREVSGRQLHLFCAGQGGSTVVLEAGLGGTVLDWSLVQPEVSTTTQVCTYDRAGMGWSDPDPQPRSPLHIADNLHVLLQTANVPGLYVVVGHSIGGAYIIHYASQCLSNIIGMVFVGARYSFIDAHLTPEERQAAARQQQTSLRISAVLSQLSIMRLLGSWLLPKNNFAPQTRSTLSVLESRPQALETAMSEVSGATEKATPLKTRDWFHRIPVVILATELSFTNNPDWKEAQQQMTEYTDSTFIVAESSGHYVHWEQLKLVVNAICPVVEAVRSSQSYPK
jgi:pimeloyl-ACP methyl ester carboxylesterase